MRLHKSIVVTYVDGKPRELVENNDDMFLTASLHARAFLRHNTEVTNLAGT